MWEGDLHWRSEKMVLGRCPSPAQLATLKMIHSHRQAKLAHDSFSACESLNTVLKSPKIVICRRARPPRRLKKLAQKFDSHSYVDEFLETKMVNMRQSSKRNAAHFTKQKNNFQTTYCTQLAQARREVTMNEEVLLTCRKRLCTLMA